MFKRILLNLRYRRYSFVVITVCFLLSSGCAGTHLYNKSNHETALKAESSFKDAELPNSFVKEHERLEELLKNEIEVVQRQTLARRDSYLIGIIGNTEPNLKHFKNQINKRLINLLFSSGTDKAKAEKAIEITKLITKLEIERRAMEEGNTPEEMAVKVEEERKDALAARAKKEGKTHEKIAEVAEKERKEAEELIYKRGVEFINIVGDINKKRNSLESTVNIYNALNPESPEDKDGEGKKKGETKKIKPFLCSLSNISVPDTKGKSDKSKDLVSDYSKACKEYLVQKNKLINFGKYGEIANKINDAENAYNELKANLKIMNNA